MMDFLNKLQENEKLKIILVSFVTFFLMIVAIMTNSIVSAYQIKVDDKTYTYTKYIEYKAKHDDTKTYRVYHLYYSDDIKISYYKDKASSNLIQISKKDGSSFSENSFYCWSEAYSISDDSIFDKATYHFGVPNIGIEGFSGYGRIYDIKSNDNDFISQLKTLDSNFDPQLSTPPTPTVTAEQVGEIPQAIKKTLQVIIPVGLVIFGAILGIYLIKRLVALFL